jgi:hypothetical protein
LIQDLKQRGLYDSTLVIWGGEFGRTVYSQGGLSHKNYGRDHHPRCFTMSLAGGGSRPGPVFLHRLGPTWNYPENESMNQDDVNLAEMVASVDPAQRLRELRLIRKQIEAGTGTSFFFDLARPLINDPNNDCRWQAMIVVGEFIEQNPEAVWQVICEFGVSKDEDMRDAVATVLLEHYSITTLPPTSRASRRKSKAVPRCWQTP